MRRRQLLAGAGIALGGYCCGAHAATENRKRIFGCVLPVPESGAYLDRSTKAKVYVTGQEEIISKSGDPIFDSALALTLAHIADTFNVLPGFAYYEDDEAQNAYATQAVRLANADGTVLFGTNLLKKLLSGKDNPDVAVAAVCAHEFGHVVQFKLGLDKKVGADQPTVKRVELQADYLAGYYAGLRRRSNPNYPSAVFALTQFNHGDNRTTFEGHHGTPEERGQSVAKGFEASYQRRLPVAAAIEESTRYVMAIK